MTPKITSDIPRKRITSDIPRKFYVFVFSETQHTQKWLCVTVFDLNS